MLTQWIGRMILGAMVGLPLAAWASHPQLIDIRYHRLAGQQLSLELMFDQPLAEPVVTMQSEPPQLLMQFTQARSAMSQQTIPVFEAGLQRVNITRSLTGLAISALLERPCSYRAETQGVRYLVTFGSAATSNLTHFSALSNKINAIDFHPLAEKAAELLIELQSKALTVDVSKQPNQITLSFADMDIVEAFVATLDVSDYQTLVDHIDVTQKAHQVEMKVAIKQNFTFDYEQVDQVFSLKISPQHEMPTVANRYIGKPISLNFQDISVRSVLQIIAEHKGFNLVTSDTVTGNITLRLEEVPWDQALDMILRIRGLGKRMEGNILLIAPAEEIAQREAQALRAQQEVNKLAPLLSEFVQVNYAKAEDIAQLLKNRQSNMLSERGAVTVDERTNTLLLRDSQERLEEAQRLIRVLDRPVRQVLIESRVVNVRDKVSEELGVRWGYTNTSGSGAISGSLEGAENVLTGTTPALSERLNIDLPVANSAGSIAFQVAKLADGSIIDLELSALEVENKGEVVASPRITTANQKAAYIEQGVEIPYEESTSSGATNIEFKKAVLSLRVTPHITPDDKIILDLVITQDAQGEEVPTSAGGSAVAIDKQEIGTQVLVNNGEQSFWAEFINNKLLELLARSRFLGTCRWLGGYFAIAMMPMKSANY